MHKILFLRGILIELNRAVYLIISLHTSIKRQHFVRNKIFSSVLITYAILDDWSVLNNMCVPRPNNYYGGDYSFYIKNNNYILNFTKRNLKI